jgi:hypothetical protein
MAVRFAAAHRSPAPARDRRPADTPRHSPLRWPAAVAVLVAGAAHLPVIAPHLAEAPYIGALFIALTVACGVLAVALLAWDTPTVWDLAILATGLAVLAYVLSRTVGLPQIGDDIGNWSEPLGVLSIAAESVTVLLGVATLVWARALHGSAGRR